MKKITIAIFIFSLLTLTAYAGSVIYLNEESNYSFNIPEGWSEIPKSIIDERIEYMTEKDEAEFVDYTVGFKRNNAELFEYPYILVQEHRKGTPELNQIMESYNEYIVNGGVEKNTEELSEFLTNVSLQHPFVDEERNAIFINAEADVAGIGAINALWALFLGDNMVTQINFYSQKSEYKEDLVVFNKIINSFEYENKKELNRGATEEEDDNPPTIYNGITWKLIAGGIIGVFVIILIGFFIKKK